MTERRYFSGNSIEQAVMSAARHYKVDPKNLSYREMEKKTGFVKTRRGVVIEVDPDSPRKPLSDEEAYKRAMNMDPEAHLGRDPNDPSYVTDPATSAGKRNKRRPARRRRNQDSRQAQQPARDRRAKAVEQRSAPQGNGEPQQTPAPIAAEKQKVEASASPISVNKQNDNGPTEARRRAASMTPVSRRRELAEGTAAEAATTGIRTLLGLAGLDLEAKVFQGEDRLELDLVGNDEQRVTKRRGEPLAALQQLMPSMIRSQTGERVFCRVDCDSFHMIQEERLRDLAQRVAEKVRGQRAQVLESMPPAERRIVHMTLADDPGVSTESLGNGYFKRVRVSPI